MSQQITCTVDDDVKDWLEQMKDDLGVSEAEIQRRCFRAVRDHDDPHNVLQPFDDEQVDAKDLRDELAALRERVAALEDNREDSPQNESSHDARARSQQPESVGADWVSAHGDWTAAESAETHAKNAALADAYQRLRNAGTAHTSDMVDVYDDHDLTVARSTWRGEVLSVLATLPGVDAPSTGQSSWAFQE